MGGILSLLRHLIPKPLRRPLREALNRRICGLGYVPFDAERYYAEDGLYSVHNNDFQRDPRFEAAYLRGVRAGNGIDPRFRWRLHVALWAASVAAHVPGDFVECGVNAGMISSAVMQYLDWAKLPRTYYLVDTFAGPVLDQFSPEEHRSGWVDLVKGMVASGGYVTDMDRVLANFAEWRNAVVVQGVVPEVLPLVKTERLAFLHLDLNCAAPERAALEHFWPLMPAGGVVLLDDYAYHGMQAQKQAIDDWARGTGAAVLSLPTGQGVIVR